MHHFSLSLRIQDGSVLSYSVCGSVVGLLHWITHLIIHHQNATIKSGTKKNKQNIFYQCNSNMLCWRVIKIAN